MSRARAGAYALWQFRDYLRDRAVPTLIVGTLSGYLGFEAVAKELPLPRSGAPAPPLRRPRPLPPR